MGNQFKSTQIIPEEQLKSIIESKTDIVLSDNPQNWLTIVSRVDGHYVNKMIIDGNSTCTYRGKKYLITGSFFKNTLMGSALKSPDFDVEYQDGQFIFTAYGYGHGVGMPADGANLYAKYDGWDYQQILTHYYTGVTVK